MKLGTQTKAQKSSHRASVNFPTGNQTVSKRSRRKAKKMIKGVSAVGWLIAFMFLLVGVGIGVGIYHLTSRDDCFYINGSDEISLTLNDKYTDEGVSIVAFGKDASDSVVIETNLKKDSSGNYYATEVGTYYIKYASKNIKYGSLFKVEKIRLLTFVEGSEGGD